MALAKQTSLVGTESWNLALLRKWCRLFAPFFPLAKKEMDKGVFSHGKRRKGSIKWTTNFGIGTKGG
jgi:hypothetical protein